MRATTPTFMVELPLIVSAKNWRFLLKCFGLGTMLYNGTLSVALGQYQHMCESREWREARKMEKGPERSRRFRQLREQHRLTEYGLMKVANDHRRASGRNDIGAHEAQRIGSTVWQAIERYMFGKGGRPRFKSSRRGLKSMEGKDNREIMYKPELQAIVWRKHVLPIKYKETPYLRQAFADPEAPSGRKKVKYCRILWRNIHGKRRWFAQIVLEGRPPILSKRQYASTSEIMGIDTGPSGLTFFTEKGAGYRKAAPTVDMQEKELRRLQRKFDRSMRANNPDNYNADGTVKKGRLTWHISRRCAKICAQIADICRRIAETRKRDHYTLINWLLQQAGTVKIEDISYRALQRGLFGKATQKTGMGLLVARLKRKAESAGLQVVDLNARDLKMSQYDPETDTYRKKSLNERWHRWGNTDILVQRDVMSAFLACYATENGHDRALLLARWPEVKDMLEANGLIRREPVAQ